MFTELTHAKVDLHPSPAFNQQLSAPTLTHAGNHRRREVITSRTSARHHNGAYNVTGAADHSCSCYSSVLSFAAPGTAAAAIDLFCTQICVKATNALPSRSLIDAGHVPTDDCHAHSIVSTAWESTVV
jgi:hypothetical protein